MLHPPEFVRPQRSHGAAAVDLATASGAARVERLAQSGCARAFLVAGAVPEVVFGNTAGGLTGGDALRYALALGPFAEAVATTQTAERAYRAAAGEARVTVSLSAGDGARIAWLPQETILFDGAALSRRTRVAISGAGRALLTETVVLGRAAMGETVRRLAFADRREVRLDGRLVWAEALRLGPDALARGAQPALLGSARAVATVALVGRGAEDAVGPVRQAIGEEGVEAAASGWDGRCVLRIVGQDALPVRRQVRRVLTALGAALPRVWQA
ncbi:urease accessory protein UreD [Roseitranquillus sediminis]|uniref:urease accessory protein UreD n=1 Tax=Roseitranquillus sediminis TaxID=2809051 RepID=UPI001D0C83E4|nr:urease accessory protein UreD [Roseitranquillus sediminis]MBM9595152.1 urease accessory protein UreD [Roseitranquillus sediminis]